MDNRHVSEVQRYRGTELHWCTGAGVQKYTSTVLNCVNGQKTVVNDSKVQIRNTVVHPKLMENSQKAQKVEAGGGCGAGGTEAQTVQGTQGTLLSKSTDGTYGTKYAARATKRLWRQIKNRRQHF